MHQYIGSVVIAAFFFAIGNAFHDALGWDAVQTIFAMILMVPGAAFLADRLLYPATRLRFENHPAFAVVFLIFVSIFAYLLYVSGTTEFERVDYDVTRYAALWWVAFPYSCGFLVIADRCFNVFKGRHGTVDLSARHDAEEPHVVAKRPHDVENIDFDPTRFK